MHTRTHVQRIITSTKRIQTHIYVRHSLIWNYMESTVHIIHVIVYTPANTHTYSRMRQKAFPQSSTSIYIYSLLFFSALLCFTFAHNIHRIFYPLFIILLLLYIRFVSKNSKWKFSWDTQKPRSQTYVVHLYTHQVFSVHEFVHAVFEFIFCYYLQYRCSVEVYCIQHSDWICRHYSFACLLSILFPPRPRIQSISRPYAIHTHIAIALVSHLFWISLVDYKLWKEWSLLKLLGCPYLLYTHSFSTNKCPAMVLSRFDENNILSVIIWNTVYGYSFGKKWAHFDFYLWFESVIVFGV